MPTLIVADVGGIHEQVQDRHSGCLMAQGDFSAMEGKFTEQIGVLDLLQEMYVFRVEDAKEHSGANSCGRAI